MIGIKYPSKVNGKRTKEYEAWRGMLRRCYDKKLKDANPTYRHVVCCEEWLNFENFYEWLHSQENFNKWINGNGWAIDKDIIVKNNKIYSPEVCCLVPQNVNSLFVKKDANRGNLPIGVTRYKNKFQSWCCNPFIREQECLGAYNTPEQAFYVYKNAKENIIKQIAKEEYDKGNITKQCYEAMINYEVEITD